MSNLLTDVFFAPEEAEKLRTVEEIPLARLRELAKAERETYRNSTQVTGYCPICAERAKQEQQEPKPLTREQIIERMFKPVYCASIKRWGVVGARRDMYTIGFWYGFEWLDDMMRSGEIYATEPKGDAT